MSRGWADRVLSTTDDRDLVERERYILEITEAISQLMEDAGVKRSELADRIGRSPAFITKVLRGTNNFTASTLVTIFAALGKSVYISYGPLGDHVRVPDGEVGYFHSYLPPKKPHFRRELDARRHAASISSSADIDLDCETTIAFSVAA